MDDNNPKERDLALFINMVIMSKCREVWVFGDRISAGMAIEIAKARSAARVKIFGLEYRGIQKMRDLAIAYGNSALQRTGLTRPSAAELCDRLEHTIRTSETVEEYPKLPKAERDRKG